MYIYIVYIFTSSTSFYLLFCYKTCILVHLNIHIRELRNQRVTDFIKTFLTNYSNIYIQYCYAIFMLTVQNIF